MCLAHYLTLLIKYSKCLYKLCVVDYMRVIFDTIYNYIYKRFLYSKLYRRQYQWTKERWHSSDYINQSDSRSCTVGNMLNTIQVSLEIKIVIFSYIMSILYENMSIRTINFLFMKLFTTFLNATK